MHICSQKATREQEKMLQQEVEQKLRQQACVTYEPIPDIGQLSVHVCPCCMAKIAGLENTDNRTCSFAVSANMDPKQVVDMLVATILKTLKQEHATTIKALAISEPQVPDSADDQVQGTLLVSCALSFVRPCSPLVK